MRTRLDHALQFDTCDWSMLSVSSNDLLLDAQSVASAYQTSSWVPRVASSHSRTGSRSVWRAAVFNSLRAAGRRSRGAPNGRMLAFSMFLFSVTRGTFCKNTFSKNCFWRTCVFIVPMSAKMVSIVADAGFFRGLSGASPRACFSRSSYHPTCEPRSPPKKSFE